MSNEELPEPTQPAQSEGYMPGCPTLIEATPDFYTADQMRAVILAEREACAELMERQHTWISNVAASALIRARSQP